MVLFYCHFNVVNLCYSLVNQDNIPPNKSSQSASNTLQMQNVCVWSKVPLRVTDNRRPHETGDRLKNVQPYNVIHCKCTWLTLGHWDSCVKPYRSLDQLSRREIHQPSYGHS